MIFKSRRAKQKMDIYKCPKLQKPEKSWQNASMRP